MLSDLFYEKMKMQRMLMTNSLAARERTDMLVVWVGMPLLLLRSDWLIQAMTAVGGLPERLGST